MVNDFDHIPTEKNGLAKISPRELLMRYVHFLPWFLLSLAVTLSLAFINLRYATRYYIVSGNIQVKDPNPYGNSGSGKFDDIFFMQPDRSLNDEIQVMRSRTMARRVVKKLNLQTSYYGVGKVRTTLIAEKESPIKLEILYVKDSSRSFSMAVEVMNDQKFLLGEKKQEVLFDRTFETSDGVFTLHRTSYSVAFPNNEFQILWQPEEKAAIGLIKNLKVSISGDASTILAMSYETENPRLGVSILNMFMQQYGEVGKEDKQLIGQSALDFIKEQVRIVDSQLRKVETNLQNFRQQNKIYSPEQQSMQVFAEIGGTDARITEQSVR